MPARYYYDPQHYERELEVFWYRTWVGDPIRSPRLHRQTLLGSRNQR